MKIVINSRQGTCSFPVSPVCITLTFLQHSRTSFQQQLNLRFNFSTAENQSHQLLSKIPAASLCPLPPRGSGPQVHRANLHRQTSSAQRATSASPGSEFQPQISTASLVQTLERVLYSLSASVMILRILPILSYFKPTQQFLHSSCSDLIKISYPITCGVKYSVHLKYGRGGKRPATDPITYPELFCFSPISFPTSLFAYKTYTYRYVLYQFTV